MSRRILLLSLLTLLVGIGFADQLRAQPPLFAHHPGIQIQDRPPESLLRRNYVSIRIEALPTRVGEPTEVELNLFPDTSLRVLLTFERSDGKVRLWKGVPVDDPYGSVFLTQSLDPYRLDGTRIEPPLLEKLPFHGSIRYRNAEYVLRYPGTREGIHAIEEIDVDSLPPTGDDVVSPRPDLDPI